MVAAGLVVNLLIAFLAAAAALRVALEPAKQNAKLKKDLEFFSGKVKEYEDEENSLIEKVKANWEDYGTYYPGEVKDKNSDGTVDIKYDDGFTENRVKAGDIKIRKDQGGGEKKAPAKAKPRDDPACKLQDFLKKLQKQLKDLNAMISQWLAGQRAKMAADQMPSPRPSVTAPPAPKKVAPQGNVTAAPTSQDQSDELDKLKAQLADLDAYIKELEDQEAKYDKKLAEKMPNAAPAAAPGVKTVDDLIAEYRAKIAQRQARVKELLESISHKQAELARLGDVQMSLKDIDEAVAQLEKDVEEGKKKRDELKKAGELDPDLRAVIDGIIKALSKMRKKVDNLLALEAKAKAEKEKAEEEAKQAAEAARKKAKEEGKNEDEAAAEAARAAKEKAADKARKAELETMDAAREVENDLEKAEKGATKLDTGLHPHGDKWWRYRYEHSYIEAIIMIFVSVLMLVWSIFWHHLKHYVNVMSLVPGAAPKTEWEELEEETHGTVLVVWLHCFADQMLVCIFVFLTVWILAKTPLVEFIPQIIKPSEDMHVPHAGEEYSRLAIDCCTIFFFAMVFYFGLMFSVAHEIRNTTSDLEEFEQETPRTQKRTKPSLLHQRTIVNAAMGSVTRSADAFSNTQKHFVKHVRQQMAARDDPELKEISRLLNDDFNNFPLSKYLKMNIRMTGVQLFMFSWMMWLPVICLFLCLLLLHRFAHMGYVRIMGVAAVVVLLMIASMGWYTKALVKSIQEKADEEDMEEMKSKEKKVHEVVSTESIVLGALEFALFFVCYGVARMICQPWMWELHFWPVLILSIVALLSAGLFVFIVAPGIPSFLCVMSLPPYVDPDDMAMMKHCALTSSKSSSPRSSAKA